MQNATTTTTKPTVQPITVTKAQCKKYAENMHNTRAPSHSASQPSLPSPTTSAITVTPCALKASSEATLIHCNTPDVWEAMSAIQDDDDDDDMDEECNYNSTLSHSQCGLVLWDTMDALMDSFEYGARR